MTQIRLSIVMCTYNGAAHLQPQLESLLMQTRLPDQIVIADDGSCDASVEILQAFVKQARAKGIDAQLHCNPRNLGYVENFSSALGRATGDVLFLCDQDDVWRADKLVLMAARFEGDPQLLLLHSDARLVDARGDGLGCSLFEALELTVQEKQAIHQGRAFEVVLRRSFVTGATAAFRRQVVGMMLPVADGWIHDEWLAAVVAASGRMDFIGQPLIDYRQHGGNQIGMSKRTLAMKWRDLRLPRNQQLAAEAIRLQRLEDFLLQAETDCASERAAQVRHKRVHFEQRVALGRLPWLRRLSPILKEARAGCYRRYGTGGRSILRDLLRHD
ncbi:glycosyltransferase family 2 protein [Rhodanobacter sp. DHB23]|uniref:glycosyltransferase family 2 protein n=1 Tax=Rhodanobacter sp. DHB23 TaxID=2775923 RepID=UPI0017861EC7|nr:glycosyltransferase family 2 protein [Rhodanobacter sp. DHB23]MBD8873271.1 glycosyltransferase family 2 protein [Rhodanobacter sp. DHB23]